jgi:hypothetical protein
MVDLWDSCSVFDSWLVSGAVWGNLGLCAFGAENYRKGGLFLEAYKKAVRSFPTYLDCPSQIRERGFFEILRHWLLRTERLVREDWIPYRVALLGNYDVDLSLKREINRFLQAEDPYGSAAFVRLGIARGEVRSDVDSTLTVSILDWTTERFQDALLTEELDPGLFPHPADP